MLIKKVDDHHLVHTPTCGEIREILRNSEFKDFDLAIALDIRMTKAHFHREFEELYFVLDGSITLQLYDPTKGVRFEQTLVSNELCVIPRGMHHQISAASESNRLCILSVPRWDASDEHLSAEL